MDRAIVRALRFLAQGSAKLSVLANGGNVMLDRGEGKRIGVPKKQVEEMMRRALVRVSGTSMALTPEGLAASRRMDAAPGERFQAQHREVIMVRGRDDDGAVTENAVNLNESPLAQIARRKDKLGRAFLCDGEVRAGERLRADYTRGQLMPRMGVNWDAAAMPGGGRGAHGIADLTQAALAARMRVEKAVAAVGPELSGVLLDVCCFLKGLETVETERSWPARSAKIVLKAALSSLARHYEPPQPMLRKTGLHWGAQDYRPEIV